MSHTSYVDTSLLWYLSRTIGRDVTREELAFALGASLSTVTRRMRDGFGADEVIQACRHFKISPLEALVYFRFLTPEEAGRAGGDKSVRDFTDLDLAHELLRRVEAGIASNTVTGPLVDTDGYTLAAMDRDDSAEFEAQEEQP